MTNNLWFWVRCNLFFVLSERGAVEGSNLAQPLLFGVGRLSWDLIFLGMIALGAFCMKGIGFGLFDALDGFSGHLSFDCRDHLGNCFLAKGIINCLFNFVVVHHFFVATLLLPPIVRFFEEVTGCPVVLVMGYFLVVVRPSFGEFVSCNGYYERLIFMFAFLCYVDHHVAIITMDMHEGQKATINDSSIVLMHLVIQGTFSKYLELLFLFCKKLQAKNLSSWLVVIVGPEGLAVGASHNVSS
jgi:hypothetical protein